jgi:poly-gamma-glutamate synthesis protein (capsule biosynthesis protein)
VLGSGDVLIHPPVWEQAAADAGGKGFDFYPIFAELRPVISGADLAICHLETPLAPAGGPFEGFPTFSAPPQLTSALARAGYDTCSTASNHTLDQGEDGVTRTIDALAAAGLGWAGSARSAAEAATPQVREVALDNDQTVQVGHLSYTFGFNGLSLPPGKEWIANRINADRIVAEAAAARAAGAEIVVLSLHWGTEYQVDPDAAQLELAERLAGTGEIDLILGHHAHVVQPVEKLGDTWVVYGMGNQLARHAEVIDSQREGALARVTFTEQDSGWEVTAIEMVPTWVDLDPQIRLVDLPAALAGTGGPAHYQAACERITESLLRRGADQDGLVVRGPGG